MTAHGALRLLAGRRELLAALGAMAIGGGAGREGTVPDEVVGSPLEVVDDHCVIIAVEIAGARRTAVLDTGTTASLVGTQLARELGISPNGRTALSGFRDSADAGTLPDMDARVGTRRVTFHRPVTLDLSAISSTIGRTIDLVVGRDLFAGHTVDLDLPDGTWRLAVPGEVGMPFGKEATITFGDRGEPTLLIAVEGRAPCPAVLDLGASAALTMSREYAIANGLLRGKRTSTALFAGANGTFVSTSVMIDSLDAGGERLRGLPAEIVDEWMSPTVPAVVRLPVLRRFRLIFDYDGGRVRMSPGRGRITEPFAEDHAGLGLARDGGRLLVRHVAAGSPAAATGWREGEVIVAVDGRSIAEVYADDRTRRWRNGAAGLRVMLTLAGGDRRELVLADYY